MFGLLVVASALSAAVPPSSEQCAVVTRHKLLNGVAADCCESCSLGYLRTTNWITSTVDTSLTNYKVEHEEAMQGSALGASMHDSDTEAIVVSNAEHLAYTRPCGSCLTYDECLDHGGHVNTWHRTCSRYIINVM